MVMFYCVFSIYVYRKEGTWASGIKDCSAAGVEGLYRQADFRCGEVKYILLFSVEGLFPQPK